MSRHVSRDPADPPSPQHVAALAAALLERAAESDDPSLLIEAAQALLAKAVKPDTDAPEADETTGQAAAG